VHLYLSVILRNVKDFKNVVNFRTFINSYHENVTTDRRPHWGTPQINDINLQMIFKVEKKRTLVKIVNFLNNNGESPHFVKVQNALENFVKIFLAIFIQKISKFRINLLIKSKTDDLARF
jgi:hypothetical protein